MKKLLTLAFSLLAFAGMAQKTILHCGSLIDVKTQTVLKNRSIVVEGKKIVSVSEGFLTPAKGDVVINLKDRTVMPGLIDSHVHLESETNPGAYLDRFVKNPGDVAYQALVYAKRNLLAGFTTVRDLGGSHVVISLRNAINKGLVEGPRVFTAGVSIGTTGGHADDSNGINEAFTLDEKRTKAVYTAFKQLYDLGLIYRGDRIVNWDPKGQTTIADDELVEITPKNIRLRKRIR